MDLKVYSYLIYHNHVDKQLFNISCIIYLKIATDDLKIACDSKYVRCIYMQANKAHNGKLVKYVLYIAYDGKLVKYTNTAICNTRPKPIFLPPDDQNADSYDDNTDENSDTNDQKNDDP